MEGHRYGIVKFGFVLMINTVKIQLDFLRIAQNGYFSVKEDEILC